ncbi:flagellar hook-basal body complex protein [Clostridium aestuarii]|uniref:Flagellar hook protein FlgE n=1 Tax=Clostridium aestuarii TaxID=338193 RepID=A0ABT4CXG5_9CLOT|nr:flagellar hook-basal body complex protein [Clostridium aestuarii]MCY6483688.1 flagellar hook-basal body complex protein [Clostridium aestuarii]
MLRSMSSVISGLNLNQTTLDIIGNNIANMGTTGYKAQTVSFADNLSQSMTDASSPTPTRGGSNPIQVGLGASIVGVDTVLTQGNFQPTNRNLDCAIDGDGYFVVSEGPTLFNDGADKSGDNKEVGKETIKVDSDTHKMVDNPREANVLYTRDGSFKLDKEGNLITSAGYRALGYSLVDNKAEKYGTDGADKNTIQSMDDSGKINFVDANSIDAEKFSAIRVATNKVDKDGGTSTNYQNELKTIKIPEMIKCPKEDGTFDPDDPKKCREVRVKNFSIDKNGLIKATLDDGSTSVIGQLAMASFTNPGGLQKIGGNCVKESPNSGDPLLKSGYIGHYDSGDGFDQNAKAVDNSKSFGTVVNGCLEMSNVDIAEQFTKMIEATRSFQANGKMISTGDEILQDLVNLKR